MGVARATMFGGALALLAGLLLPAVISSRTVQAQDMGDLHKAAKAAISEHGYGGSKSCKKCHSATFKSWDKTAHGQAFETLKPGVDAEVKTKFNLDPSKDYTKDESCLKCHTTGSGHASGYFIPDESDKKAVRKAKKFHGAGCESCHGAGEAYSVVFKEIMTSKRKYKVEELQAVGLQEVTEQTCTACHNADSPTHDASAGFDFEKMKEKGVHDHVELKQRDG